MPQFTEFNITPLLLGAYGLAVLIMAIFSIATTSILFKHAEKRNFASGVIFIYLVLVVVVLLFSLGAVFQLF